MEDSDQGEALKNGDDFHLILATENWSCSNPIT